MASERKVRSLEKKFSQARDELLEFMADHADIFDKFHELTDTYNATREEAVGEYRKLPGTDKSAIGVLTRSKAPQAWKYEAHKLPTSVLKTPGVVKSIDNKAIEQGIVAGTFDADLINNARHKTYGTPRITGPATVVIKVA